MAFPYPVTAPELSTHRMQLRRLSLGDARAIFELFANPDVARYQDVEPFTHFEEAQQWIERMGQRQARGEAMRWAMVLRETGRLVGTCGYVAFARRVARGTLGYEIGKSYWGRGLMPEGLAAIIRYGFEQLDLHRIDAYVMTPNARSARVLQKLGFAAEGVLRDYGFWKGTFSDLRLFSLLRSDSPKWAEL
jgi:ribosomal-protein-alanine N-acetyltransferase